MPRRIAPRILGEKRDFFQFLGIILLVTLLVLGFVRSYVILYPMNLPSSTAITFSPLENQTARTGDMLRFTVRASGAPGDTMKYSSSFLPWGAELDGETGTFSWKPAANQSGSYHLLMTVSNGRSRVQAPVTIDVEFRNLPPVIESVERVVVRSGERMELRVNASDPEGDPLTYYVSGLPEGAVFDNLTKVVEWQVPTNQHGSDTFAVTVSDGWSIAQEFIEIRVNHPELSEMPRPRPLRELLGYLPGEDLASILRDSTRPIHVVAPSLGPGLQERISQASSGDIILVYPGTYQGGILLDQSLVLVGVDNPVIDALGNGSVISLTTGGATVAGFTLVNSGTMVYDSGIKVSSSGNRILNNRISGTQYGVNLFPQSNGNVIRNNTITNCTLQGIHGENLHGSTTIDSNLILNQAGDGVHIEYSWNVSLRNNTIAWNGGNGITLNYTQESFLEGNRVESNTLDGTFISSGARDVIRGNSFLLNGRNGLSMELSLDPTLRGDQIEEFTPSEYLNRVSGNTCSGNDRAGVALHEITALVKGNTCRYNSYGVRMIEAAALISGNRVSDNGVGIFLVNTESSVLRTNEATGNEIGIYVEGVSKWNTITANNASMNREHGFFLGSKSSGNTLRDNLVMGNTLSCISDSGLNMVGANECQMPPAEAL
jgi:parallel beta-helix repeat protein